MYNELADKIKTDNKKKIENMLIQRNIFYQSSTKLNFTPKEDHTPWGNPHFFVSISVSIKIENKVYFVLRTKFLKKK